MSDENNELSQENENPEQPGSVTDAAPEGSTSPEADQVDIVIIGSEPSLLQLQARLAELVAHRDRQPLQESDEDFHPYRDGDRVLSPGTIVRINGIPCRLLAHVPVIAPEFRDEAVFAESLAAADAGLAANAEGLRRVYNRNGKAIGINESHGSNRLDAEIADLKKQIAELEAAVAAEPAEAEKGE